VFAAVGIIAYVAFMVMSSSLISTENTLLSYLWGQQNTLLKPTDISMIESAQEVRTDANDASPDKVDTKDKSKTIYVDPGHGGDSSKGPRNGTKPGGPFKCDPSLTEAVNNYAVALQVKSLLEKEGYSVQMSRNQADGTSAIGNYERGKQGARCDGYIAIHSNGGMGPGCLLVVPDNFATEYNHEMGDKFLELMNKIGINTNATAYCVELIYSGQGYKENGGDTSKFLYCEIGAHDDMQQSQFISSDDGRKEIAKCIVEAFLVCMK